MTGFMLNNDGDVVISDGRIQIVKDNDLIAQEVRQLILTNLGEWEYNPQEGIDRYCMLTKKPTPEQVEENILSALRQVDPTFQILSFSMQINKKERNLTINFSAVNDNGAEINIIL